SLKRAFWKDTTWALQPVWSFNRLKWNTALTLNPEALSLLAPLKPGLLEG
ncbi:hypothetical protein AVEN_140774-1, partial [Araneus ventricosus]